MMSIFNSLRLTQAWPSSCYNVCDFYALGYSLSFQPARTLRHQQRNSSGHKHETGLQPSRFVTGLPAPQNSQLENNIFEKHEENESWAVMTDDSHFLLAQRFNTSQVKTVTKVTSTYYDSSFKSLGQRKEQESFSLPDWLLCSWILKINKYIYILFSSVRKSALLSVSHC